MGLLVMPVGEEEDEPSGYRRVGLFEIVAQHQAFSEGILERFPPGEVIM